MKVMSFTAAATIEAAADVSRGHVSVCVSVCTLPSQLLSPISIKARLCCTWIHKRQKSIHHSPRTLVPFLLAVQSWLSFSSSFSSFSDGGGGGGGGGGSRCQRRAHIYKSRSKEKEREREMVIIRPADCHPLAFYTILPCKGTNPPTNPLDINGMGRREGGVAGRLANEKTEKRPNTPI